MTEILFVGVIVKHHFHSCSVAMFSMTMLLPSFQIGVPAHHGCQLEPEGVVAVGESSSAHAEVPDGLRRADRPEGSHLLPSPTAGLP